MVGDRKIALSQPWHQRQTLAWPMI